ncbi:sensor histidine kinase [Anaeromyxobacter diazotrophicus]|uniref:histidine kinase n=1 Tax=Anaeromyxobacter diazotrophicus TaxID=2590199 RepID=A0A7I9VJR0_9BACT|nr:sensor histidine kinase [Anaeromyxobacter diazotrophicus]GEJ56613.1 two-component sensor histidine kinase [Anaeromyxobacter diazotrophicus]
MKLSEFIHVHQSEIVQEWEAFAQTLLPAAAAMSKAGLRDHASEILAAIEEDIETPEGSDEQARKSKGRGQSVLMGTVGKVHAVLRIEHGFSIGQLVAEYRALRASVLWLYERSGGHDVREVTRFNESIDAALAEATTRFMVVMDRTRHQFLAVLGHDLRAPLSAVLMTAALVAREGDKGAKAAARIVSSVERMTRLVNDLIDLTRTRLGSGIPINPVPVDLEVIARDGVSEFCAIHPECNLQFHSKGDLRGHWDPDRLAQVLSNLIGNALQHGEPGRPVRVAARGDAEQVVLDVHNEGEPILDALLANIFEPMVRHVRGGESGQKTSLGLGLHIVREVTLAHGGTVAVTSTAGQGTTFSVRLPRRAVATPLSPASADRPDEHDATGGFVVH